MDDFQRFLDDTLGNIRFQKEDKTNEFMPAYDIYREIRDAIAVLLKEQHMTQKELAERTRLTQANICNLEKGKTRPTIDTLRKIADATGTRLKIEFVRQEVV